MSSLMQEFTTLARHNESCPVAYPAGQDVVAVLHNGSQSTAGKPQGKLALFPPLEQHQNSLLKNAPQDILGVAYTQHPCFGLG